MAEAGASSSRELEYSVDRVFAFHEYCQSAPWWRVVCVLVFYGLPALALLFIVEVVPLQNPNAGWWANGVYWMRVTVSLTVAPALMLLQTQLLIPEVVLTKPTKIAAVIGPALAAVGSLMLLARYWRFPVLFALTVSNVPFFFGMNVITVIALRAKDKVQLQDYRRFLLSLALQGSFLWVYPAYNAIFASLRGSPQLAMVVVLPIMKYLFKRVVVTRNTWDDDLVLSALASVDVFDAMYMAKRMQSTGTLAVGVAVIVVDLVHSVIVIQKLAKQTQHPRQDLHAGQLLRYLLTLLENSQHSGTHSLRFRSNGARYSLSTYSQIKLMRLQSCRQDAVSKFVSRTANTSSSRQVFPYAHTEVGARARDQESFARILVVKEALLQPHASEEVIVVEYIEAIIPFLCAIYLAIMTRLPNIQYYEDLRDFTEQQMNTVTVNILIYAGLELLSVMYV